MKKIVGGTYATIEDTNHHTLYSIELNRDISLKFINKELKVGGLTRDIPIEKVKDIFAAYDLTHLKTKFSIKIIGGDNSDAAVAYFKNLISTLQEIEGDSDIFDISYQVNSDLHPNFCFLMGQELS